jgi:hypothetical protein
MSDLQVHHIKLRSRPGGGDDSSSNVITLFAKRDRPADDQTHEIKQPHLSIARPDLSRRAPCGCSTGSFAWPVKAANVRHRTWS